MCSMQKLIPTTGSLYVVGESLSNAYSFTGTVSYMDYVGVHLCTVHDTICISVYIVKSCRFSVEMNIYSMQAIVENSTSFSRPAHEDCGMMS